MGVPCQVPAIAPVTGRLDYAQDEAALLFRFAHARTHGTRHANVVCPDSHQLSATNKAGS
jgi:hypothetical protein